MKYRKIIRAAKKKQKQFTMMFPTTYRIALKGTIKNKKNILFMVTQHSQLEVTYTHHSKRKLDSEYLIVTVNLKKDPQLKKQFKKLDKMNCLFKHGNTSNIIMRDITGKIIKAGSITVTSDDF